MVHRGLSGDRNGWPGKIDPGSDFQSQRSHRAVPGRIPNARALNHYLDTGTARQRMCNLLVLITAR